MQAYLAEFVGTALLILLGNGVVANVLLAKTKGNGGGWIVITLGWGMAVFVAVWCVGEISGAHINPAVTIGLSLAGKVNATLAAGYVAAQMLGAVLGATLVFLFYRDHYAASGDADAKLATFATGPAIRNYPINLFSEVVGTFVLALAGLLAVDPSITRDVSSAEVAAGSGLKIGLGTLGALPAGLLVLAIGLSLGGTTGYAINPARDLGPRIAHALLPIPGKRDSDWAYAWVPVVGPILGAILAVLLWWVLTRPVQLTA
ncbi:MAG TPA: MIP/aquaporin family protein [Lacipirellulaceae bacterium]|jgi:glycerol uptake facilitator protein|nr:MIP/aquaporin family protein [Lacipirellulaceae bacterium]